MRIAVFTGTRAEYGLLSWLMRDIQQDKSLELLLIVSGSHLSPVQGLTKEEILEDGFQIDCEVEMLVSSATSTGTVKSLGLAIAGYADALQRLQPDIVMVLGDRYEGLGIAQASVLMRIPVFHLHGGEITEGAYDDSIRHAITKLSILHGVSTEDYRRRVIQLGEHPDRVFNVGALGIECVKRESFISRQEVLKKIGLDCNRPYFLVTYHSTTLYPDDDLLAVDQLCKALDKFPEHQVIWTSANADEGGLAISLLVERYVTRRPLDVVHVKSLGQISYLSAMKYATAVVGNSSSGIIEAPSLFTPTVNIGKRQSGRLAARSVIHAEGDFNSLHAALKKASSPELKNDNQIFLNPYGDGNCCSKIINALKGADLNVVKSFFDIGVNLDVSNS